MADQTTGELTKVNVGDLPAADGIYDDFKMPGEFQGGAVHITGAMWKAYAVAAVASQVKSAAASAEAAAADATAAQKYAAKAEGSKTSAHDSMLAVINAINSIPEGSTPVINDLSTGGTNAALSAEMGKVLARKPNPNLLHNWFFAQFVNQRGETAYQIAGYTGDRWLIAKSSSASTMGTMTVEGGGIRLTGGGTVNDIYLRQKLENAANLVGKPVTMSVLADEVDGTWRFGQYGGDGFWNISSPKVASVTFTWNDNAYGGIQIWNAGAASGTIKIRAIKLEIGSVQTLAQWDGTDWVLNELPDYGEELAKCQRFQTVLDTLTILTPCYVSASTIMFRADLPTTMRANPQLEFLDGTMAIQTISGTALDGFTFALNSSRPNKLYITASKTSHGMTADNVRLVINGFALADANL